MKKLILTFLISLLSLSAFAQKDVTKFLGIPVDGTKSEMIRKLKAKGFRSTTYDRNTLEGEFNGYKVEIIIQTNNNKVWRIVVMDKKPLTTSNIKTRFNNLCYQFNNNAKYYASYNNSLIPESENIDYEILVNKKKYQALYYQQEENTTNDNTSNTFMKCVWFTFAGDYDEYTLAIYYENLYNKANGEDL